MALRAVIEHPKFARLMMRLDLDRWQALGLLESLWHFAGRFTPRGDIGKYPDEDIAAWIGYKGDPSTMMEALVSARWIDRDDEHRLVVHDWRHHADDATKLAVKRSGSGFVVPTVSGQCRDSVGEAATGSGLPVPEPVPEPDRKRDTSYPQKESVNGTVSRNVFKKPSVEEIGAYFREIGLNEPAENFFNFYESKNWMIGKNKMSNWKAAAQTWKSKRSALPTRAERAMMAAAEVERRLDEASH